MDASRGPARKPPRICGGTTLPQPLAPSGRTGPSGVSIQSQAIAQRSSQVDLASFRVSSQTELIAECSVDEMRASCLHWSSVSLMAWAMI